MRRGWRSRWAAIGAAVAVSLGGGGLFVANAAVNPAESSFVPVDPVRVVDSRTVVGVAGPLSSLADQDVQVTGTINTTGGMKAVVPVGANGVVLNLTAIRPTADGFISVRPGGSTGTAATSSLNFDSGAVVANSVTVSVPTSGPDAGEISLRFDAFGISGPTANVAVDIVGYTTNATLTALQVGQLSVSAGGDSSAPILATATAVQTVELIAPAAGEVLVSSSLTIYSNDFVNERGARCAISRDGVLGDVTQQVTLPTGSAGSLAGSRAFPVTEGESLTIDLICVKTNPANTEIMNAEDASLIAHFVAS